MNKIFTLHTCSYCLRPNELGRAQIMPVDKVPIIQGAQSAQP